MAASPVDSNPSMEHDDSEPESNGKQPAAAGKPGRKKNPNSQAARRDQNRIAQREFRLRKQQRIRDLEARVELLSGNQDETFDYMRSIVRNLVTENSTLRNLVKNLSGVIGEGLPAFLPEMGWEKQEFEAFLDKADTDTAIETFTSLKRKSEAKGAGLKRLAEDQAGPSKKKARMSRTDSMQHSSLSPATQLSSTGNGQMNPAWGRSEQAGDFYPQPNDLLSFSAMFDIPYNPVSSSSMLLPAPSAPSPSFPSPFSAAPSSDKRDMLSGGLPSMSLRPRMGNGLQGQRLPEPAVSPPMSSPVAHTPSQLSSNGDTSAVEAFKLIHYHLENYRRSPNYCLPQSLRPTLIQRTLPHDTVIDGIPIPELRDRMILLKGRFDLADCTFALGNQAVVHGDDVLAHANWELGEEWVRRYAFLVDQSVLNTTNRWRMERGESEIVLTEIALPDLPQT